MDQIQVFNYNGQNIEFDLSQKNVMINASAMAAIYGKKTIEFLSNSATKSFISECLTGGNSHRLGIESEADLVLVKSSSGTWMHRILALKFAAWLNPTFELWVYLTIDDLLFGVYKRLEESLKNSAQRKNRIAQLQNQLEETEVYQELERLQLEEKQAAYRRSRENKNQLDLFRSMN